MLSPAERWMVVQASALIVFSSWAGGGSYAWGPSWMLALAAVAIPIGFIRAGETGRHRWWPFLPAAAWIVFCAIASLNPSYRPLPTGGWLPQSFVSWLPSTVDRRHTFEAARSLLAALIEGAALVALAPSRRALVWLWRLIALNGFALAAVGAFFRFSGAEQMLGFIDAPEPTYFFATFFYKNHWAAFGALTGATALGLIRLDWAAALAGDPEAKGRVALFGGAGLLTLVTLPLPGSRAGALLVAAIVVGFAVVLLATWRDWRRRRLALSIGSAAAVAILAFGVDSYLPQAALDVARTRAELNRSADTMPNLRLSLARDTWHMAQARPWFGWGPGAFAIVFPAYQGSYLRGTDGRPQARVEDAHNDWLQLLAECGFIGAAVVWVPAGICLARGWKRGSTTGRWIFAICGLVALYAWIDFPFRNPAVLMLWTVLFATAATASRNSRSHT